MKSFLIVFLFSIGPVSLFFGQCGETGLLTLVEDGEELELLNGCDSIFGDLKISILDDSYFEPLSDLEYIEGDFIIEGNVSLLGIDELIHLKHIGGNLIIQSNFTLLNLNGFDSLSFLGGNFEIIGNWSLNSLENFGSLHELFGNLIITENNVLENVNGLDSLMTVAGNVEIDQSNIVLNNISGLNGLEEIGGKLKIQLDELTSFNGCYNLTSIADSLIINDFQVLANLNGLNSLVEVGSLIIQDNQNLVNVDSLSNLSEVNGDLIVQDNPSLFLCCGLYNVLNTGDINGFITIENNASACGTPNEILEECIPDSFPSVAEFDLDSFLFENGRVTILQDFNYFEIVSLDGKIIAHSQKSEFTIPKRGIYILQIIGDRGKKSFKLTH